MKNYKVVNGISFKEETSQEVCNVLSYCMETRKRVKLTYGDVKTGKSWNEDLDICGRIGKSTGEIKVPLLIHNVRSSGGGAICDDSIIKIACTETGKILYQANNYQKQEFKIVPSDLPQYAFNVLIDGEIWSRHKTERAAKILIKKLS